MKTREHRRGALLVVTVIVLMVMAVVGVGLLSMATSARYQRFVVGWANRAYYLAESGASYVKSVRLVDTNALPKGLFTLGNGDQFDVNSYEVSSTSNITHIVVVSTGIVNPGTRTEMRRRVVVDIVEKIKGDILPIGFDYDEDGNFDEKNWGATGVTPRMKDTGPSDHLLALDLKGEEGLIYLKWQNNPQLNLLSIWGLNGGLLSYDIQMKINAFDTSGNGFSGHYMLGLSFRLNPVANNGYGLSFFKSLNDKKSKPPSWVTSMPADFQALRGTNIYLVLWRREGTQFTLINHRLLTPSDGVVEIRDGMPELRDYSTMLVQLDEVFDSNGNRENHIVAYMQDVTKYPVWNSRTNMVWQTNTNVFPHAVTWDNGVVTNVDSHLTSVNFSSELPAEIGVHVFYDNTGANKKFFTDFAIRMEGYGISREGEEFQY